MSETGDTTERANGVAVLRIEFSDGQSGVLTVGSQPRCQTLTRAARSSTFISSDQIVMREAPRRLPSLADVGYRPILAIATTRARELPQSHDLSPAEIVSGPDAVPLRYSAARGRLTQGSDRRRR
jgi:hypothetical protein